MARDQFWIVLTNVDSEHSFVKDFTTREAADQSCKERNARAKELGYPELRYEVVDTGK